MISIVVQGIIEEIKEFWKMLLYLCSYHTIQSCGSGEGQCRFKDCKHINEKGCAVIKAVEKGDIDMGVYENYLKLRKEAWHYTTSLHEKRKQEKSFSRMVKGAKKQFF